MMEAKFKEDQEVLIASWADGKYRHLGTGTRGMINDRYQSPTTGEFIYEVRFFARGDHYELIRQADLVAV